MQNSLVIGIIVVIAILVVGGWLWYASANPANVSPSDGSVDRGGQGTLYVSVKDAAVDMKNVTAVHMTVDRAYVHSQTQGWVLVSDTAQTFSLLELKNSGKAALLAKVDIAADTYDQIWFHVSDVKVTQSGRVKTATLPSNDLRLAGKISVMANGSSSAIVDVIADQSMHQTSKGEIIFAPVVEFESRSRATVAVDASNMVDATGGTVDATVKAGMDITGDIKNDFKLDANSNLQINGGVINLQGTNSTNTNGGVNLNY